MAEKLRPDELAAFKAAFDMFDKNQDGTISTKVSRTSIPCNLFLPLNSNRAVAGLSVLQNRASNAEAIINISLERSYGQLQIKWASLQR